MRWLRAGGSPCLQPAFAWRRGTDESRRDAHAARRGRGPSLLAANQKTCSFLRKIASRLSPRRPAAAGLPGEFAIGLLGYIDTRQIMAKRYYRKPQARPQLEKYAARNLFRQHC